MNITYALHHHALLNERFKKIFWSFSTALLAYFVIELTTNDSRADGKDERLDVYWVDVEGGAATLLVTPAGESILIDTGNPGRRDPQRIVDVAVKVAGLRRIDHLVTTHYHGDHFGGAATLSLLLPIGNVYDNGEFPEGKERPDKAYLEFQAQQRIVLNPGDALPVKNLPKDKISPQLSVRCLATRQKAIEPPSGKGLPGKDCNLFRAKDRDGSDNANSVVLLVGLGDFRFFDAGDLTWNIEQQLVCPQNLVGEVDVYQVTHHGLDASNNPILIRNLSPAVAIMNNGVTKGCAPEVFANLKETASIQAIYQVHKNLRPDGTVNNVAEEYIANKETAEKCAANYIKLSVAPDAKSYSVAIPANKHERTFKTKAK